MELKEEIKQVKELGEKIGYGHLMSLASALWRESLEKSHTPVVGAFVPTISLFISDEYQKMTQSSSKLYDELVKKG